MITFNTQKEFEDTVMKVIKERLSVNVHCYTEYNMRLLTTREFSKILDLAYEIKGDGRLGEALWNVCRLSSEYVDILYKLLQHAKSCKVYLYRWQNDLAVIKYFIDNFVEEF
jgi:hypothetical protein